LTKLIVSIVTENLRLAQH